MTDNEIRDALAEAYHKQAPHWQPTIARTIADSVLAVIAAIGGRIVIEDKVPPKRYVVTSHEGGREWAVRDTTKKDTWVVWINGWHPDAEGAANAEADRLNAEAEAEAPRRPYAGPPVAWDRKARDFIPVRLPETEAPT